MTLHSALLTNAVLVTGSVDSHSFLW